MTIPWIEAVCALSAAGSGSGSGEMAGPPAEPVLQPGEELVPSQEWPLRSFLELQAVPAAVRCARLHARNILREWGMEALADTVELLVSEIITNAVHASATIGHQQYETDQAAREPRMRFLLTSDRHNVLIRVWDGDHRRPARQNAALDAESGRGLLLIEALSTQWGCYTSDGQRGKIVWAVCGPE
jgi:anti-sigma regulatory factor (Ser/Thr protein kinase)